MVRRGKKYVLYGRTTHNTTHKTMPDDCPRGFQKSNLSFIGTTNGWQCESGPRLNKMHNYLSKWTCPEGYVTTRNTDENGRDTFRCTST